MVIKLIKAAKVGENRKQEYVSFVIDRLFGELSILPAHSFVYDLNLIAYF